MNQSLLTILAFIRQRDSMERIHDMVESIQRDQKQKAIQTAQLPQTRIIIRRTFGEQSFLELYSDM